MATPKSVGSRCCFSTCGVSSALCRGVSFHSVPKKGVNAEQDAWHARLIYLASRADKKFNHNTAKICSRHFTDDCFLYSGNQTGENFRGRRLKFGAQPTLHLPKKFASIPDPERQRKRRRLNTCESPSEQNDDTTEVVPPPVAPPDTYVYDNMASLLGDLPQVSSPWCVTNVGGDVVQIAVVKSGNVEKDVTVNLNTEERVQASVRAFGIPVPRLSTKFRDQTLSEFLLKLSVLKFCSGLTDVNMQELAEIPDGKNVRQCYRHILNDVTDDGQFCQKSCVRSRECDVLLAVAADNGNTTCSKCSQTGKLLKKRMERRAARDLNSLHVNDPLHAISVSRLKDAFKKQRADKKKQEIRANLEESVQLSEEKH